MTTAKAFSDAELAAQYPTLLRWAGRHFSPADAEEVVQETLLRAHRSRDQFQPGTSFGAWLQQIVMNVARDRWRAQKRVDEIRPTLTGATAISAQVQSPVQEHVDDVMELIGALEQLSPAHRELLVLFYMYDLSYKEVAEKLGVPVGTVLSRLHRARKALSQLLRP